MAKSILATFSGNDYQARIFWLQACQALYSDSKIEKVGYEVDDINYFDDVVVRYKSPVLSERNEPILADYWQAKYHVDARGILTYQQLIDPKFINSKTSSILERVRDLQRTLLPNGSGVRFYFVSPWHVQYDDPLAKLVSKSGGEVRLEVLFSDSKEMKNVREKWKKHLQLINDDELEYVIRPLRISVSPDLQQQRNNLNAHLIAAGLSPVDDGKAINLYDDLIRKIRGTGRIWFSGEDIKDICKREGLWVGREEILEKVTYLGIRSFTRWAENMENETYKMINLVQYFDGRLICSPEFWMKEIHTQTEKFFQDALKDRITYALHLDCHSSIAFGAGYSVGTKSGFEVAPVQKTVLGKTIWRTRSSSKHPSIMWSFKEYEMGIVGKDICLIISITHAIADDVREYIKSSLPTVSRIITCELLTGTGGKIIEDGEHAYHLVQQLVQWLKQNRNKEEKQSTLHIFNAAPNGFMFFLGQQSKVLGKIQLYEYDFDNPSMNGYQPSLKFPNID